MNTCAAKYCENQTDSLMCVRHWKMLRASMRREIHKWAREGKEMECHPMTEYTVAVNRAVKFVLQIEQARNK